MITFWRHAAQEAVTLEAMQSGVYDGQGRPSFDSPVSLIAHVERQVDVIRLVSGEEIRTVATAWFDATQDALPSEDDRVTLADGFVGIVVQRVDGYTIQHHEFDHVMIKLREA